MGAHLDTTTIGWMEPLTLTLSPLRGARELANRMVVVSRCAPSSPKSARPRLKSVRRDAERGGRDARAPQRPAFRRFKMRSIIYKDVVGEGADHHTRGKRNNKQAGPLSGLRVLPKLGHYAQDHPRGRILIQPPLDGWNPSP